MLKITHNAGFFSCCSVRLHKIIEFWNNKKTLPTTVDSSQQFEWYKPSKRDITNDYFDKTHEKTHQIGSYQYVRYFHTDQYSVYSKLPYEPLNKFILKYFTLSNEIDGIMQDILKKYQVNYDNTCALFYRGNDKRTETRICTYEDIIERAEQVYRDNPNIRFLIQSDETEFITTLLNKFPQNSFYFNDEIRHIKKQLTTVDKVYKTTNFDFSKIYLAITVIMSQCKRIICTSGNCSIWIMFYRGNANNVDQNLNGKWYTS